MFKYHSDMGHCFSQIVVVFKKSKKKNIFFFTFLHWDMVLGKKVATFVFSIGNGAEIQPIEMGRKSPVLSC